MLRQPASVWQWIIIGIVLYLTSLQLEQVVPFCFVAKPYFACPIFACVHRDLNNPARFGENDILHLGQLLGDYYLAEAGAISEFLTLPKALDGLFTLWCGYIGSPA